MQACACDPGFKGHTSQPSVVDPVGESYDWMIDRRRARPFDLQGMLDKRA